MNYLQKLFMLTVLGLGVYVNEVLPNEDIQAKIHRIIEQKSLSFSGTKGDGELAKLLSAIQDDLKQVLKSAPDTAQYKQLKEAVNGLNPSNLLTMIGYVRTILANIDPKTKTLIMEHVPAKFKPFVA